MTLHPKIGELIVKSYNHAHNGHDYFVKVLESLPLTIKFKQVKGEKGIYENNVMKTLEEFLASLPVEDALMVIKDALEDPDIKRMEHDNWNNYGDYVKYWRKEIITYLERSGIKFDEKDKSFYRADTRLEIGGAFTSKKEFISSTFYDDFYNNLKKEINRSYRFKIFTGTVILSRKIIENLIIDIMRLKFPPNNEKNIALYFRTEDGRFHDLTILLKNLEAKKEEFKIDMPIIEHLLTLIKPFRPNANSKAHSIIMIGEEKELLNADIERMVELLLKIKNNLLNDLRNVSTT